MKKNGFTLVELLLVIAIITILFGVGAISLESVLRSSGISESSGLIESELSLARQSSLVRNREYEIRFYSYIDPNFPNSTAAFRAFQVVVREPELDPSADAYTRPGSDEFNPAVIPITRVKTLTEGVIIIAESDKSPLLIDPSRTVEGNTVSLWGSTEATYTYFRFTPNGSTDLDLDKEWFFTLAHETSVASGVLKNIAIMRIDPSSGKMKWLQP